VATEGDQGAATRFAKRARSTTRARRCDDAAATMAAAGAAIDRTRDFLKLSSDAQALSASAPPLSASGAARTRPSQKALHFTQRATQISKGIQTCAMLLSRLTTVAKSQNLFSEEGDELNRLSLTVKNEMNDVKKQLSELQTWLAANDLGTGKDAKLHSEAIVKTMGDKLLESGNVFERLLKNRRTSLVSSFERKRIFGGDDVDLGKPMSFAHQEPHGDVEAQQSLVIPDVTYVRSRVEAISAVEKHINDLGQAMGTLATLISTQEDSVNSLAGNVERSNLDLRAGFNELQRYYQSIAGNQKLIQRLFAVVVAFCLFFLVFLA